MIKNKYVDIKPIFKTYLKILKKKQVKNISRFQTDICFTKYHKTIFKNMSYQTKFRCLIKFRKHF